MNRDVDYWLVGAYMAPLLEFGYLLGGSAGLARLWGIPAHVGSFLQGEGGPRPLSLSSFAVLDHLQWADKPLRHYRYSWKLGGAMLQCMSSRT